jgi:hypothetical protein
MGPIHFEDLEPHRFEDLVRQLVYDFKDWQSIEATGRGGNDEGFDIRAYERTTRGAMQSEDAESEEEILHPMDGNLWMFQCKREKDIGPKRVADIVSQEIDPKAPPYGYILAAPANFSKTSYDKFRERLRELGVMEFYLWGKAELEDMLHQPKNDHILFTFFGVSLVSRRRSRTTEVRSAIASKNKLFKLLGENPVYQPVLLRDIKDVHYPYEAEYKDFKTNPRWKEFPVVEMDPLGLIVEIKKYYAFRDSERKEWDYTRSVNLVNRQSEAAPWDRDDLLLRQNVEGFWELLPRSNQVMLIVNGLIRFDSIAIIDHLGDSAFKFPHIYVDFEINNGPFYTIFEHLQVDSHRVELLDELKRVKKFPDTFSEQTVGTIYRDKSFVLNPATLGIFKNASDMYSFYRADNTYQFLKPCDVIEVDQSEGRDGKRTMIRITNKRVESGKELIRRSKDAFHVAADIERQIGRKPKGDDTITVFEFKRAYDWQLKGTKDSVI